MIEESCRPSSNSRSFHFIPRLQIPTLIFLSAAALLICSAWTQPALAQTAESMGKLNIHVSPKQAYVFVDGRAIRDGSQSIKLAAGDHTVAVYNYGYSPKIQQVHINASDTAHLDVALQNSGAPVTGPFGYIELKGPGRAAVLLNGTTPDYFVGHVDEFNWDWIWHQRLLVHPGTYQVTVTREGNTIWTGPVTVQADQKVVVYVDGRKKTRNWPAGSNLGTLPRFHAGVASATVPIAPVTAELAAEPGKIECGESAALNWKSSDAVDTSISGLGSLPANGERSVNPLNTATYQMTAKGPGGVVTRTVTVDVDSQPTVNISLNEPVVRFHKIGDKVVSEDSATLRWSTSNADHVTISNLDNVAAIGSQVVTPDPAPDGTGVVDKTVAYQLTATNACGGTATRTAMLHVVGSVDPAPAVQLASVFYPTAYPTARHPRLGLLATEQRMLTQAAERFKNHREFDSQAQLVVVGHADVRGSQKYNLKLSERRAELAKSYLVSHGIPANEIQLRAEGKEKQLSREQVARLQTSDAEQPEKWMNHKTKATWLAYNRRVDIILEPAGVESARAYPNDAADSHLLWQEPAPSLHAVKAAESRALGVKMAGAVGLGH